MFSAQRQALIKVNGIDGYFDQKTGGEVSGEASKVFSGGKLRPSIVAGPAETDDIVVTMHYDPDLHQAMLEDLKKKVCQWRTTISITPTRTDLTAAKVPPTVHPEALLTKVVPPEWDAGSSDATTFELTFAVPE